MKSSSEQQKAEKRRRAEELLRTRLQGSMDSQTQQSLEELLHELAVHQIELEIQNEELRRTEARLGTARKKYADLYTFAPVGYFSFDAKGKILEVNPAGVRLLGVEERGGLLGKLFFSFCEKSSTDEFYLHLRRVMKSRKPGRTELVLLKDGEPFDAMIESVAVQDEKGNFSLCQSALLDITDRKRSDAALRQAHDLLEDRVRERTADLAQTNEALRESEGRFRTMADGLPLIVWVHDAGGQLQLVNRTYCEFFGVSEAEMHGGRWQLLVHPDDASAYTGEFLACVRDRRPFHAEVRVRRADGEWCWIESWARPRLSVSGEYLGFVGASADVSERKQVQANLHAANAQLAEADRHKDEFLAMLAHELRNPLAPVRYAVQILRAVGSTDPTAQRQNDVIERQVTHMARLLDDLLDVSRVTLGKINMEQQPLLLIDVLSQAIEIATPLIQHRRHELSYTPPTDVLLVEGDPDRLAQVFGNLLTNAAKYTGEGGRIDLEAARQDGQVVVRVRDNGAGIAPELLPRVFDLFAQADQTLARSQGGLGIGLTMVHKLVQMHGGTVEARSAGLGQGSEFIVQLPALAAGLASGMTSPKIPSQSNTGVATARRVLIVDDITDSAESLAELLALWSYETQTAHSGATALDCVRWFRPDVVLLDIGMPGMDGLEVARRLRQMPEMTGAVLVAMTGYCQAQDYEATRAAGFNHHLVKPVELDVLRGLLDQPATGPR